LLARGEHDKLRLVLPGFLPCRVAVAWGLAAIISFVLVVQILNFGIARVGNVKQPGFSLGRVEGAELYF